MKIKYNPFAKAFQDNKERYGIIWSYKILLYHITKCVDAIDLNHVM